MAVISPYKSELKYGLDLDYVLRNSVSLTMSSENFVDILFRDYIFEGL